MVVRRAPWSAAQRRHRADRDDLNDHEQIDPKEQCHAHPAVLLRRPSARSRLRLPHEPGQPPRLADVEDVRRAAHERCPAVGHTSTRAHEGPAWEGIRADRRVHRVRSAGARTRAHRRGAVSDRRRLVVRGRRHRNARRLRRRGHAAGRAAAPAAPREASHRTAAGRISPQPATQPRSGRPAARRATPDEAARHGHRQR